VRIAHRRKGSSRMVGAREQAAACEAMERAVGRNSPEETLVAMDWNMARLEAHLAQSTLAFEKQKMTVADGLIVLVAEDDDFQRRFHDTKATMWMPEMPALATPLCGCLRTGKSSGIALLPGGASGSNKTCCAATRTYSTRSSTVSVEMCLCSFP
jgi:HPt (histidine-containing phosphotransfer) domain-containing protein